MKRGRRKNLRQEQDLRLKECKSIVSLRGSNQIENLRGEQDFRLKECQSIVSPRGFNQIEIMDAKGESSLALLPESMRLKRGVTQRKRRRGRSDMCEVYLDLVIEILIRLPAKSLLRFKCVSKQWSFLISSPYFCHRLFTLTRQQQQQQCMSLEDDDGQRILLSISSTSPDKTCFVVDQDVSIPGTVGLFLNVVRGLICFPVSKTACVYNSTTGQHLTLPAVEPDIKAEKAQMKKDTRYYIGYDPVNDQYKLVCTVAEFSGFYSDVKSEHWVLLLEAGGGSWKKVVPPESYHPHVPSKQVWSTTNGSVVHYTAWIDEYTRAVVSFDIRSEELTTTPVPEEAGDVGVEATWTEKGLIEYGGKIAVFDHTRLKDEGLVDLWVLKDAVGEKKWSEKERLVLQPCQRHLVPDDDNELVVKGTTQDGKLIFAPSKMHSSQLYILFYDLQSNDLRKVGIKGVPPLWSDKDCYFGLRLMDESQSHFCFKSLHCC